MRPWGSPRPGHQEPPWGCAKAGLGHEPVAGQGHGKLENGLAAAFLGQELMTPGADMGSLSWGAPGAGRDGQGWDWPQGSGIFMPTSRVAIHI